MAQAPGRRASPCDEHRLTVMTTKRTTLWRIGAADIAVEPRLIGEPAGEELQLRRGERGAVEMCQEPESF